MAIYHFHVGLVSRDRGQSSVASAAYRSASVLEDERLGLVWDYTGKRGVEHTEILAPPGAPDWVHDRERLWNAVEKVERRKDAQLAREVEFSLPVELSSTQRRDLSRDFTQRAFVSKGMVAELAVHADNPDNPHAHVMLSLRSIGPDGFGLKRRDWNQKSMLQEWRGLWAEVQNEHLARAGLDIRVDHRTLKAQGVDLDPGRKIGVGKERQSLPALPAGVAERVEQQRQIARENGEKILADPRVALNALTHQQATFTDHDLAKWLNTRTDGAEQFTAAHLKITASPDFVVLGRDDRGRTRYSSREMVGLERSMLDRAAAMTARKGHAVPGHRVERAISHHKLSEEQGTALRHLTETGALKAVVGVAGGGKSRMLGAAREAWEAQGFKVRGTALSGIAAENLQLSSQIESRTIASFEHAWKGGRDALTSNDILVIDEAGMLGTRQLGRILEAADRAKAKVVLVGDPEQLQAIEAGGAFRGILAESGYAELTEVRRQLQPWQQEATKQLQNKQTAQALEAYRQHGLVHQFQTRVQAQESLLARWVHAGEAAPTESRLMLAYTRADVKKLNELARAWRLQHGQLGRGEEVETELGRKEFAAGERIYFLRNERSLGVKNGSLGTVESVRNGMLQVKLDATQASIVVDSHLYRDLDYGYAATAYKAQGSTVDRAYVLASSHFDRHSTYVAMTRHRQEASIFYATEDFRPPWRTSEIGPEEGAKQFIYTLSRARPKDLAHDYLERNEDPLGRRARESSFESIEVSQERAVERWREMNRNRETEASHSHSARQARNHDRSAARSNADPAIDS